MCPRMSPMITKLRTMNHQHTRQTQTRPTPEPLGPYKSDVHHSRAEMPRGGQGFVGSVVASTRAFSWNFLHLTISTRSLRKA